MGRISTATERSEMDEHFISISSQMDADSRRWKKRMVKKPTPRYPTVNPFFSIHVHLRPSAVHIFLFLPGFPRKRLVGESMLQAGCGENEKAREPVRAAALLGRKLRD
jgi:hypothetical protein